MMQNIKIGTRGSRLALWQANLVQKELKAKNPNIHFEKVILKTEGDRDQKSSLSKIGGQGVFTKTIEDALLEKRIDLAVHSLKDLPSTMAEGLDLGATLPRGPVEDVLVTKNGTDLKSLKQNAHVATGSIRRRSQLLQIRPDLQMNDLRGNIDTRLDKLNNSNLDAILMARAAIERLEIPDVNYFVLSPKTVIPAVGQGAIGVQLRENDIAIRDMAIKINHLPTEQAVCAERAMLRRLDSGCQFPVGAHAWHENGFLHLTGIVASENGDILHKRTIKSGPELAENLGDDCARLLIKDGALDILNSINL
jgi:hydroxymethylbilane synthase